MIAFRRVVAVLLLFLWGTATVHCGLELDGLLGNPSHGAKVAGDSGDSDPDGCGAIENGCFDGSVASFDVVAPLLAVEFVLDVIELRSDAHAERIALEYSQAPPELAPLWTFQRRASLPARAPDFVA